MTVPTVTVNDSRHELHWISPARVEFPSRRCTFSDAQCGQIGFDPAKRKVIYKELQDLILEDLPYVILTYYEKPYVVAKNVTVPSNAVNTERIFLRGVTIG